MRLSLGDIEAAKLLNKWVNDFIRPEYVGVNFSLDTVWILKGGMDKCLSKESVESAKRELRW